MLSFYQRDHLDFFSERARAFRPPAEGESLSLAWPRPRLERGRTAKLARRAEGRMPGVRESNQREGRPTWRLPGIRQLLLRCSDSGIHAVACPCEKEPTSCRFPLRGLSSPPHRHTGAPGRPARHRATAPALRQLGHPCPRHGAHSVRHRCAVAKAEESRAKVPLRAGLSIQRTSQFGQKLPIVSKRVPPSGPSPSLPAGYPRTIA
jgi:hypothetical protein